MITLDKYSFSYGQKKILDDISYQLESGKCYCLVGENGAGKTTLIESILGFKHGLGEILFNEKSIDQVKNQLGVVFQENGLTPRLKVKEELMAYVDLFKVPSDWKEHLIDVFQLASLLNKVGNKLSGGERRRVLIALAFINHPKYVILDEPFTGIDTRLRIDFRKFIEKYVREQNAIVLFSEHNILECKKYEYTFLFLFDHKFYLTGTAKEILEEKKAQDNDVDLQDVYLELWGKQEGGDT